jgi:hypothetical protein
MVSPDAQVSPNEPQTFCKLTHCESTRLRHRAPIPICPHFPGHRSCLRNFFLVPPQSASECPRRKNQPCVVPSPPRPEPSDLRHRTMKITLTCPIHSHAQMLRRQISRPIPRTRTLRARCITSQKQSPRMDRGRSTRSMASLCPTPRRHTGPVRKRGAWEIRDRLCSYDWFVWVRCSESLA